MALILNEEQQMLRESAKSFIEESSPVSAHRERRDRGDEWSPELWQGMAEMGWAGMTIPEAYGGLEFGYVGAGLVMEECGRVLAPSPLLSSAFVCGSLITSLGSDEQKETLLPAIASGETILALAISETDRFDPTAMTLNAQADGDGFMLNGSKRHVLDGQIAGTFIVAANSADEVGKTSLFIVASDAPGIAIEATRNADNRLVSSIQFDGVRVAPENLLGAPGAALPALERALDIGAVLSAAELSGVAQEAFERTLEYLKERKQFGVPVGSFQALQHRAAQLFCELELCKSVILKAEQAIDEDSPERSRLASLAKAKTAKTARLAVNEAVQMFAGIGMTDEFDIGFFMKRAAAACQEFGDYYYHADRFALLGGY
ncbi:MAG: acyl-CoA dehydrogenase family protein [Gammaproteobacteria bacterium]|nr:acyl-CoA dehydrogenase family protein [Gammaproteobacteria bacterium]